MAQSTHGLTLFLAKQELYSLLCLSFELTVYSTEWANFLVYWHTAITGSVSTLGNLLTYLVTCL